MRSLAALLTLALGAACAAGLAAQAPAETAVSAFEVTSIKPRTGPNVRRGPPSPDRFAWPDTTLHALITYAYDLLDLQVTGAPDWANDSRWEVNAKAPEAVSPAQMRMMVRRLLEERFALKAHFEKREHPVYELVLAREDGRLGPRLRRTDDAACKAAGSTVRSPNEPLPCGLVSFQPNRMLATGIELERVTANLPNTAIMTGVDRPVINRTGLDGSFSIDLSFRPVDDRGVNLAGGADNPTFFDAFVEQLGLRLRPARAPIDVLIVESASPPAAD